MISGNRAAGLKPQSCLREHHERMVLCRIRRDRAVSSVELAAKTGLSAQTVSKIVGVLEDRQLLRRTKAEPLGVGKPPVPLELSPSGMLSIGLLVREKEIEATVVDFTGQEIDTRREALKPQGFQEFTRLSLELIQDLLSRDLSKASNIAGIGVALAETRSQMPLPPDRIISAISRHMPAHTPIYVSSSGRAACLGEHVFGNTTRLEDYAYIYLGDQVDGGAFSADRPLFDYTSVGQSFGDMPIPTKYGHTALSALAFTSHGASEPDKAGKQVRKGVLPSAKRSRNIDHCVQWVPEATSGLIRACEILKAIVNPACLIVDGPFSEVIRTELVSSIQDHLFESPNIKTMKVMSGSLGQDACRIGSAALPIHARFSPI